MKVNRKLAEGTLKTLAAIPVAELGTANRVDHDILRNNLESIVFETDTVREWTWNPLLYNVGGAIFPLLSRDFAPLPERLRNVRLRLEAIPAAVAAAKANLQHPPRMHVETAIKQNPGTINLVREGLDEFLDTSPGVKGGTRPRAGRRRRRAGGLRELLAERSPAPRGRGFPAGRREIPRSAALLAGV